MNTLTQGPDAYIDQKILFCGHAGYFIGDVIITPFAVTVITKTPVTPDSLNRKNLTEAEWNISDRHGGYWNPLKGRFVLPREAVTLLTPENIDAFLP